MSFSIPSLKSFVTPATITSSSSNLILDLDAGNSSSYSGTGKTWYDLSGNGFNATLVNGVTYDSGNNGTLVFSGPMGSSYAYTPDLNSTGKFTGSSDFSHFIWFYLTSQGVGNLVVESADTTLSSWHDSNIEVSNTYAVSFSTWHGSLTNKVVSSAQTLGAWYHLGMTYSGTTLTAYINGASIGTTTFTRQTPYPSYLYRYLLFHNDTTNMGTNAYPAGKCGGFQVYNKGLSGSEVTTIFNAKKARYGL